MLAALACRELGGGRGPYRAPAGKGFTILMIKDLQRPQAN